MAGPGYDLKSNFNLGDGNTNVVMSRLTDFFGHLYHLGFYDRDLKPRLDTGFSGDAAIVMRDNRNGKPIMDPDAQERIIKKFVDGNEGYHALKLYDGTADKKPVYLAVEGGDINKKVVGLEWDKIVVYQPHEPDVLDYLADLAKELKIRSRI